MTLEANILSIVTFLPLVGALILLILPNTEEYKSGFRWGALAFSIATFIASLFLLLGFQANGNLHFVMQIPWIPAINAEYYMGVDGISLWLVLLNTFLFPLAILSSIGVIKTREKMYYVLMLVLETAVTGVFLAQDLLLFYFFWEAVLIPMYFLIGVWGGKNKLYATTKFVLFTMVGSLLMLVAIIALYLQSGAINVLSGPTFSLAKLMALDLPPQFQFWCFLAFALAFAIKVPLFPFHTWLPDAHTEAPTAGSIILAGVLLKMGTYGFIRFALPLFPDAAFYRLGGDFFNFTIRDLIMALAVIGIIYGALVAAVQIDVKRLVAYSSIAHLGFVMLGLMSFNQQAVDGAILQMVNHGISTGALFMLVGFIYDRRHTRLIADFGGIAKPMPVYFNFFLVIMLSSVGLPALNGFAGEFPILLGSFQVNWLMTLIATLGVILAAVYLLYMFRRVFFGEVTHPENKTLADLVPREVWSVLPLAVMTFVIGLFPTMFFGKITPDSHVVLTRMQAAETASDEALISRERPRELPPDEVADLLASRAEGGAR
ncbi:NADH-quinone oxidoreductase subunit M [bacterium]|nr:NADH-quinone oxidoreductase subunit M [bacterium]